MRRVCFTLYAIILAAVTFYTASTKTVAASTVTAIPKPVTASTVTAIPKPVTASTVTAIPKPVTASTVTAAQPERLMEVIHNELHHQLKELSTKEHPPYYLSCRVDEITERVVSASFGQLERVAETHFAAAHPEIRVGSPQFDNFHNNNTGSPRNLMAEPVPLLIPYNDKEGEAVRQIIRGELLSRYQYGVTSYKGFSSSKGLQSGNSDKSPDFTPVELFTHYEPPLNMAQIGLDTVKAKELARELSQIFTEFPNLLTGRVTIRQELVRKYFISTEGASIAHNALYYRLYISTNSRAEDGMDLPLSLSYFAHTPEQFPSKEQLKKEIRELAEKSMELREAPTVEPYTGPALLSGAASGVFFHEIFGHRIEGQKMKSDFDGQTFKQMVGDQILPENLSVYSDPTITEYIKMPLSGHYQFDDQGVKGERVAVVEQGYLRNFLMSRTAIEGFPKSNGHGRAEVGYDPTSRQSNLIVESSEQKTFEELKELLREEAANQGREYGYFFKDVSGGYTITGRSSPNAFNVTPIEVYKVFVDGTPDQLVRGVDLIGTPLSMFSNIIHAGGEVETFNGMCGAASGRVPVSALSPALLVSKVELQKKPRPRELPPILPAPDAGTTSGRSSDGQTAATAGTSDNAAATAATSANAATIFAAMEAEANRTLTQLTSDRVPTPFYISYSLIERQKVETRASLGATISTNERPNAREIWVRPLIGNYKNSSLLAFGPYPSTTQVARESDQLQLQRALWLATDQAYKDAALGYRRKANSKELSEEIPDFYQLPPNQREQQDVKRIEFTKEEWEEYIRELSTLLESHPYLEASLVRGRIANTNHYYYNSEGSRFVTTTPFYNITVIATLSSGNKMLAAEGSGTGSKGSEASSSDENEQFSDKIEFTGSSKEQLPTMAEAKAQIDKMANALKELATAQEMEEYYSGPVLFQEGAAASLFVDNLLVKPRGGLISRRDNINLRATGRKGGKIDRSMVSRIGKKILDTKITVKDLSGVATVAGEPIAGYIDVDGDGVTRPKEITLVEKGLLRELIGSRMPADSSFRPTGHLRYSLYLQNSFSQLPTYLKIEGEKGYNQKKMKRELLKLAASEGLEYAYIIKQLPVGREEIATKIYRVDVKSGQEQLVKNGSLLTVLSTNSLKRIRALSAREQTVNSIYSSFPIKVTLPYSFILEDIELNPMK